MSREDLAARLTAAGALPDSWAAAFAAVDRAAFIPGRVWFDDPQGRLRPLDRDSEPGRWLAAVHSDEPIVTQLDDGATVWPATSNAATSSASQPSMVLVMLDALDVHDGQRVLEIGTGTGYHTVLLAHRLGAHCVTSVEVDSALTEQARTNLRAAGYHPTVVCADGVAGWAGTAPYDRVIATAAVLAGHLPYAWVRQTRPGGLILTPWGTAYCNGALLRLTVHDDHTATGRFIGNAAFMRLRAQRTPFGHAARLGDLVDASAAESVTAIPPDQAATGEGGFSVGLHLPDVQCGVYYDDAEHYEVLLYHVDSDSVANVAVTPHAATQALRWCNERRWLNQHTSELARPPAQLYPAERRMSQRSGIRSRPTPPAGYCWPCWEPHREVNSAVPGHHANGNIRTGTPRRHLRRRGPSHARTGTRCLPGIAVYR